MLFSRSTSLLAFITLLSLAGFAKADQAQDLLEASDRSRGGITDGLAWKARIITEEDGDKNDRDFYVRAKDDDAYVEATAPVRNKGEVYLFNNRNMWFFKPSLKKPVSISSRQKLTGQAANGDIASTHYARDYTPKIEKTETAAGGDKLFVLLLKAKAEGLTYDQIRYWVSEKSKLAVKAEFLTLQGTPFKKAEFEYDNNLVVSGKKIPFVSRMIITDAKFATNKSTIIYENVTVQKIAPALFQVNSLAR